MKRQHTYEQVLHQKLNGLQAPNVAGLWDKMETILDQEMPVQEEKKRRIGAWWMNANLLVAASLFLAVGSVYTLCQVSGKQNTMHTVKATLGEGQAPTQTTVVAKANGNPDQPSAKPGQGRAAAPQYQSIASAPEADAIVQETSRVVEELANPNTEAQPLTLSNEPAESMVANETAASQTGENPAPAVPEEVAPTLTAATGNVELVSTAVPAVFARQEVKAMAGATAVKKAKRNRIYVDQGVSIGLALNAPFALGQQQRNELDLKGQKNAVQDYLPSVYLQWHLNKQFYVQAEWQPVAAQYTPNFTLYNRTDVLNPDEKEQKVVKLNKLFYTSVPVSVHYKTPVKNLTVGLGAQYSKLKKVLLQDQEYYHLIQAGGAFKVEERKNEVAVKDPETVRGHNTGDVVDSVARSFRREDWRLLADVSYQYKGFNLGVRYTKGLHNFVNTNFTNLAVKDRTQSLQLYLRYNLFDSRKK